MHHHHLSVYQRGVCGKKWLMAIIDQKPNTCRSKDAFASIYTVELFSPTLFHISNLRPKNHNIIYLPQNHLHRLQLPHYQCKRHSPPSSTFQYLHPSPSPSTLNPQPSTLNLQPSTQSFAPYTTPSLFHAPSHSTTVPFPLYSPPSSNSSESSYEPITTLREKTKASSWQRRRDHLKTKRTS